MRRKMITVSDRMQQGYAYLLTAPAGKKFHPEFKPELTPKEMLALGVFGGVYMRDCMDEFPSSWFKKARFADPTRSTPDARKNYFGVVASQSLDEWKRNKWIHPDDPRGWFQWYCRYYMGRRHPDDERQIKRWKAVRRHIQQLKIHCRRGDHSCRPRQRQALLHWAYDSRRL